MIFVRYWGLSDNSIDERKRRKSFAYGERWIIINECLKVFLYVRHHFDLSHGFEFWRCFVSVGGEMDAQKMFLISFYKLFWKIVFEMDL